MSLLAQADRVIAPSEFIARIYREHGLPAANIVHLPYGLDPGRFASMPPRKDVRGKPHLDLGYVGSISRHKGVQVLIEAMQHVEAPNVRLHLHGRRDSQPGFSEALIDSIADPRITFHGAFAPAELGTVLSHLDALVVPSLWYENTPFSVLEALHAGVPVIASGGIGDLSDLLSLLPLEVLGVTGVIVGRALYDGRVELSEALQAIGEGRLQDVTPAPECSGLS